MNPDVVKCEVCGQEFKTIAPLHLKHHGLTTREYKIRFPHTYLVSEAIRVQRSLSGKGQFQRIRQLWDGSNWDDGYVDKKGHFRVYRPDYPRVYAEGMALRAHVVWWLNTGSCPAPDYVIHHDNLCKTDDSFENLKHITRAQHTILHCKLELETRICVGCGAEFKIERARVTKYCSRSCYHNTGYSPQHRENISKGLKRAYSLGVR